MAIKVLIVDDSALMRRHLRQIFETEGDFEIAQARNGEEALTEVERFQPDVVTLDINMPQMDGLTALAHMMAKQPVPVIMVSSLTAEGALATLEALALGAVDYVVKPGGTISSLEEVRQQLVAKVRRALSAKPRRSVRASVKQTLKKQVAAPVKKMDAEEKPRGNAELVLIGVSTGGPSTLEQILPQLPVNFPAPIVIAQHMPATFTTAFAQRMDMLSHIEVMEITRPCELQAGRAYIARGGADVAITRRNGRLVALPRPESAKYLWHPSIELLADSALDVCTPNKLIAVMLTGMGDDGADSFARIRQLGGLTIAESEQSCVVFGMPKELIVRNGATKVLAAEQISEQLLEWCLSTKRYRHGVHKTTAE